MVWRRLRALGALGFQHGVWILPHTEATASVCRTLLEDVRRQGGTATIFLAQPLDDDVHQDIVIRSRLERDREYTEFCTQAEVLLAEVARETAAEKLTFAELAELEHDARKLETWLHDIEERDFFGAAEAATARAVLTRCQVAVEHFATTVYTREGILPTSSDEPASSDATTDSSGTGA